MEIFSLDIKKLKNALAKCIATEPEIACEFSLNFNTPPEQIEITACMIIDLLIRTKRKAGLLKVDYSPATISEFNGPTIGLDLGGLEEFIGNLATSLEINIVFLIPFLGTSLKNSPTLENQKIIQVKIKNNGDFECNQLLEQVIVIPTNSDVVIPTNSDATPITPYQVNYTSELNTVATKPVALPYHNSSLDDITQQPDFLREHTEIKGENYAYAEGNALIDFIKNDTTDAPLHIVNTNSPFPIPINFDITMPKNGDALLIECNTLNSKPCTVSIPPKDNETVCVPNILSDNIVSNVRQVDCVHSPTNSAKKICTDDAKRLGLELSDISSNEDFDLSQGVVNWSSPQPTVAYEEEGENFFPDHGPSEIFPLPKCEEKKEKRKRKHRCDEDKKKRHKRKHREETVSKEKKHNKDEVLKKSKLKADNQKIETILKEKKTDKDELFQKSKLKADNKKFGVSIKGDVSEFLKSVDEKTPESQISDLDEIMNRSVPKIIETLDILMTFTRKLSKISKDISGDCKCCIAHCPPRWNLSRAPGRPFKKSEL